MKPYKPVPKFEDILRESTKQYEVDCDEYWDKLSYDDKLKSFYSVVKRICKGELEDRGSYRWVLYNVFGFNQDSYSIGMDCGFLELHNAIYSHKEIDDMLKGFVEFTNADEEKANKFIKKSLY